MQICALQPNAGAGASALPLQSTRTAVLSGAGAEICMCEIGKRGNHRSKTPGGPRAAKERARGTARPASGRSASMTSRARPSALSGALKDSGGGGFLRDRRLLTRGAVAARLQELPERARKTVVALEEVSALARAGSPARPPRGSAPSPGRRWRECRKQREIPPLFRGAVRPAPCPCRGILARRRQDTSDPSAKIRGWEGVSRKPRGAGKEEEARGWSEDRRPGCRGCSASSLVG